jgi:Cu/Ag efflux pump CusA
MVISFFGMRLFGVSGNLMSLGAIGFGMIVDGAVVMIRNSGARWNNHGQESTLKSVRRASHAVGTVGDLRSCHCHCGVFVYPVSSET